MINERPDRYRVRIGELPDGATVLDGEPWVCQPLDQLHVPSTALRTSAAGAVAIPNLLAALLVNLAVWLSCLGSVDRYTAEAGRRSIGCLLSSSLVAARHDSEARRAIGDVENPPRIASRAPPQRPVRSVAGLRTAAVCFLANGATSSPRRRAVPRLGHGRSRHGTAQHGCHEVICCRCRVSIHQLERVLPGRQQVWLRALQSSYCRCDGCRCTNTEMCIPQHRIPHACLAASRPREVLAGTAPPSGPVSELSAARKTGTVIDDALLRIRHRFVPTRAHSDWSPLAEAS